MWHETQMEAWVGVFPQLTESMRLYEYIYAKHIWS